MVESLMLEKMVAFFVPCTRPPIEGPPTQLTAVRSACAFLTTVLEVAQELRVPAADADLRLPLGPAYE